MKMNVKKVSGRLLFLTAYFAYASIYIARLNLTVASPVMQEERLLSAAQIGSMGGIFFLFYSFGQLLNGYLGDVFPPKLMVLAGLLLTGLSNMGIGLLPDTRLILLLWGANGFAQSMLWGPLLRTISAHYPPRRQSFIASFLVSSVGVGSVLGVFIATAAIYTNGIGAAFLIPGALSLLAFVLVCLFFHTAPCAPSPKARQRFTGLFSRRLTLLLLAAACHGVLKDNINLWAASYFADAYSVDLLTMSFYVFVIPLLSLLGRLIYPPVYRLLGEKEHLVSIAALALTALCLLPLCLPHIPILGAALCMSAAAAAISLVNTSFLTIFPMHYQETGNVSLVVGLMDFATYMGAGISSSLYGKWLENHSWAGMFAGWILLSCLAIVFLITADNGRRILRAVRSK